MVDVRMFQPWLKNKKRLEHMERREEDRVAVIATADLIVGSKVLPCRIVDIATHGCRLKVDSHADLKVCAGELATLRLQNGQSLAGILRWIKDDDVGLQLTHGVNVQSLMDDFQVRPAIPRAGRAPICLSVKIANGHNVYAAQLLNISATGAQVSCEATLEENATVFVHSDLVRPIGGYVRWSKNNRTGIMFNRLLPVQSAEAFSNLHGVNEHWLEEVQQMHRVQREFVSAEKYLNLRSANF